MNEYYKQNEIKGASELNVELLKHTPEPEQTVAASARLCYSPTGADKLLENMTKWEVEKLLNIVIKGGHHSTLEHTLFTFAIEGISRVCSHQLVRHRIASYSQQSQRYVYERDFEYIVPKRIYEADRKAPNKDILKKYVVKVEEHYEDYLEITQELKDVGYEEKESIETARYLLPNASETKIVVSMNARSLLHFFSVRTCERAQAEIRDMAREMLKEARKVAPLLFKKAGPLCETDKECKEGKMSCGKLKEILNKK